MISLSVHQYRLANSNQRTWFSNEYKAWDVSRFSGCGKLNHSIMPLREQDATHPDAHGLLNHGGVFVVHLITNLINLVGTEIGLQLVDLQAILFDEPRGTNRQFQSQARLDLLPKFDSRFLLTFSPLYQTPSLVANSRLEHYHQAGNSAKT
jgi:hypothetical protein